MRGGAALVLAAEPLVLYVFDWVLAELPGALLPVFRRYRYRPVHLLVELSWARDDAWNVDQLSRWKAEHLRRHTNHRMHCLANAEAEQRMMTARGLGSA